MKNWPRYSTNHNIRNKTTETAESLPLVIHAGRTDDFPLPYIIEKQNSEYDKCGSGATAGFGGILSQQTESGFAVVSHSDGSFPVL